MAIRTASKIARPIYHSRIAAAEEHQTLWVLSRGFCLLLCCSLKHSSACSFPMPPACTRACIHHSKAADPHLELFQNSDQSLDCCPQNQTPSVGPVTCRPALQLPPFYHQHSYAESERNHFTGTLLSYFCLPRPNFIQEGQKLAIRYTDELFEGLEYAVHHTCVCGSWKLTPPEFD